MKEKIKKEKTSKVKKSKYPEWYIGRPKPMKTNNFKFHKPTKKFYIGLVFFLLIAAFITYIVIRLVQVSNAVDPDFNYYEYDEKKQPESYVLENNKIRFELDPLTTQFTILQKNTGHVWYSNNPETQNDPIALPKEKNLMQSPVLLRYSTENGVEEVYDVFMNSVKRNFYNVSKNKDVISVQYTVGQMDREYIIPLVIYGKEMDEWLSKMSKSDANKISSYYHKYVYDDLNQQKKEELLEKYPHIKSDELYLVFDNLKAYQKERTEQLFAKAGYTMEDYNESKEMYKESSIKDVPSFNITVNYSLTDDGLAVEIPFDEISYKNKYPLVRVAVLPYFGCAGPEDKGYMLVPEGCGYLIDFNNGKTRQSNYYADCYGWDYAKDRKGVITETRVAFPVFGMAYEDSSFISIMEEGDAYGGVTAEIAGKLGSYNYVRAEYKMLHSEQFEVSVRNISAQYSFEKHLPYGEKIRQVYKFVDSPDYVDMAKAYREYLFAKDKKVNNKKVPVSVEIIGAIDKTQQILGIPKVKPYMLTSYTEAKDIIGKLSGLGLDNAQVKLLGFVNEGIRPVNFNKLRIIKQLGNKKEFKALSSASDNSDIKVYLDGMVQFAYRSGIFKGVNRFSTPARFASSEICKLSEYSALWYGKEKERDTYYLLNPKVIDRNTGVFINSTLHNGFKGISFRDNGYLLSGDYNDTRIVSRETAKNQQVERFNQAKDNGLSVMVNAGNSYAVKTADVITNMNFHGNAYAILDRPVPFYQIALHGYRNFTGLSYNLSYEGEQILLESAECGAGLNFSVMGAGEEKIQETYYTEYYCANFESNKDKISGIYKDYNQKIGKVSNALIEDHEYLNESVTVTVFDNGCKVFVNFGYVPFTTENGIVVAPRSFIVQEEK
ncbi:MAG: hypothetical protein K6E97_02725 [Treponema sp.]|nr:hypothetical protein [Treponema sp.]